jgi:hypothetical protein
VETGLSCSIGRYACLFRSCAEHINQSSGLYSAEQANIPKDSSASETRWCLAAIRKSWRSRWEQTEARNYFNF